MHLLLPTKHLTFLSVSHFPSVSPKHKVLQLQFHRCLSHCHICRCLSHCHIGLDCGTSDLTAFFPDGQPSLSWAFLTFIKCFLKLEMWKCNLKWETWHDSVIPTMLCGIETQALLERHRLRLDTWGVHMESLGEVMEEWSTVPVVELLSHWSAFLSTFYFLPCTFHLFLCPQHSLQTHILVAYIDSLL